jgi:MFS family permease
VLSVSALAIAPLPLLWAASDSLAWLIGTQVLAGIAWAGFELGMLMALFEAGDDAERTTTQVAFSAMQAVGTAGASLVGGSIVVGLGGRHTAYLVLFGASAIARLAAAALLVRRLPAVLVRLPFTVATRVWTFAIRPWGGTHIRPIADSLDRRRLERRERRTAGGQGR